MSKATEIGVVIVAGGRGLRMGGSIAKQWQALGGIAVAERSVAAFQAALPGAQIVVVLPAAEMHRAADFPGCVAVAGGAERSNSVQNGLQALDPAQVRKVLIHDAARPLVPAEMILRVAEALDTHRAAAPGLALADALWRVEGDEVIGTAPRAGLWRAQTPQGFDLVTILEAHRAHQGGALDDVEVALSAGIAVKIVAGDERALKLTVPEDLARAEALVAQSRPAQAAATEVSSGEAAKDASAPAKTAANKTESEQMMDIRVGQGFDVHAFTEGDHVMLCGVKVPHTKGFLAHSDGDVGLHALCDAIYGALSEGDIGRHFPPSEAAWKGKDSMHFLDHAAELVRSRGYRISQVDVTLICERPKIGPHAEAMRERLAPALGIALDRVSVKATTSERLGFTGREEGIAAMAVVTLIG